LLVAACGAGGESREPTTTVPRDLAGTVEDAPVQLDEDEADEEGGEDGTGDEGKGNGKRKDRGNGHGNGQGGND
jgi:hypothetical protein